MGGIEKVEVSKPELPKPVAQSQTIQIPVQKQEQEAKVESIEAKLTQVKPVEIKMEQSEPVDLHKIEPILITVANGQKYAGPFIVIDSD